MASSIPSAALRQAINVRPSVPALGILLVVLHMLGVCSAEKFYFNFPNLTDTSYFVLQNNATASGSDVWLLPYPDPTRQTGPDETVNSWSGWMSLYYPFSLSRMDSTTQQTTFQSFNTSFTFRLITSNADGGSPSGMAFFMTTYAVLQDAPSNRYFGLPSTDTAFFAVEFDTKQSTYTTDVSNSHVGIDYGTVNSSASKDTSSTGLDLYRNTAFKVWISYDSSSQLTKVWMTDTPSGYDAYLDPPDDSVLLPILEYNYCLSDIFATDTNQSIGFSAATQSNSAMLGVVVSSWYFIFDNGTMAASSTPPPPAASAPPSSAGPPQPPGNNFLSSPDKRPTIPPWSPSPPSSEDSSLVPPPVLTSINAAHCASRGFSNGLYATLYIIIGLIIGQIIVS